MVPHHLRQKSKPYSLAWLAGLLHCPSPPVPSSCSETEVSCSFLHVLPFFFVSKPVLRCPLSSRVPPCHPNSHFPTCQLGITSDHLCALAHPAELPKHPGLSWILAFTTWPQVLFGKPRGLRIRRWGMKANWED